MSRSDALFGRALSLGAANMVDYGLQFILPIVLTRCLSVDAFGQYRLLWLAVGTVTALVTFAMPQSLYYFLPRSNEEKKRLYINQTALFMAFAGAVGAAALSPWNPLLPSNLDDLLAHGAVVPAFVLLWITALLLDLLPTVEERIRWQAKVNVGLSMLRAFSLATTAWMTRDLASLLVVLVCFVAVKLSLLVYYIARHHGLKAPLFNWAALLDQIRHAAPFGMSGALNQLRAQGDQWVVASLFAVGQFAAFSVASVLSSITYLLRQSVNNVFLPQMSMMQANGDIAEMLALNNKANTSVSFIVYPLLAFCFAFADTIVTLVYTSAYAQGGAVMRVYIIGLLAFIIELNSVMLLYRQGAFAMWTNMLMLMACIPASYFGAKAYGLPGAAIGSVVVAFLERIITLWRIAALTSVAVSRLQDWKSISKILLAATLAGLAATVLNDSDILSRHGVPMLLAGGLVVCGLYALLVRVLGLAWIFRGFVARRV